MKIIRKINYSIAKFFYGSLSCEYKERFLKKFSNHLSEESESSDKSYQDIHKSLDIRIEESPLLLSCDNQNSMATPVAEIQNPVGENNKDYFCVLSLGSCGSVWLTNILNSHSEIICSVGTDHPVASISYSDYDKTNEVREDIINQICTNEDIKYGANFAVEGQFIPEVNVDNYHKYLNAVSYGSGTIIAEALKKRGIEISVPCRTGMTEDFPFFFREMERFFPRSSYYGNIHGLTCEKVASLIERKNPFLKKVIFADLIRHPITRLESIINHYRLLYDLNIFERKKIEDSIESNSERRVYFEQNYQADFDITDNKIRFYCNYVAQDKGWTRIYADDIRSLKVQRILFERIKNEPEYLAWFISYLTGGRVSVSKSFLDSVYNDHDLFEKAGRMGKIKIDQKSARDQWIEWPEWQKKVFRDQCEEYDLYSLYAEYNYDLSFVKNYE